MEVYTCPTCRDLYELAMSLIDWASGKRVDWDFICYFCGAQMPNPHRPGCLHIQAQKYLEMHNDRRDTETNQIENLAVSRR